MNGRKRHVLADTQSLLLEALVQPASVQERAGGQTLLMRATARPSCGRLPKVWADGGFDGTPFRDWVREHCGWELEVVAKPEWQKGFAVLPRHWVGGSGPWLGSAAAGG